MKKQTGYPSTDNIHNIDYNFFSRNPIIPNMSIYNTINLISNFYRKEEAIDCLDLNVNYDEMTKSTKFMYKGTEYYKTGNIGILDEDGYFTLTGRSSRYYIRSDLNKVYLEHIQNVISLIDVVDSVVVVPKPDKDLLFTNKAYVVLKDGILPTKEVNDYILDMCYKPFINKVTGETIQLKPYEVPESITFLDTIPRTKADKADYRLLEELAKEEAKLKEKKLRKCINI